jgi:hypothetical protein
MAYHIKQIDKSHWKQNFAFQHGVYLMQKKENNF